MSGDRQDAKRAVLALFDALETAPSDACAAAISGFTSNNYRFRGVHPFNEIDGADDVAATVWQPLKSSFTSLQRRQDIFMAAPNLVSGDMWVTSMGKFMGLFDRPWLGIRPTRKIAMLPYCEFHRVENGKITESALWIDIISVMKQSGFNPLGPQTGAEIVNPGPQTNDGLMFDSQEESESKQTLDLIMSMCDELIDDGLHSSRDALKRTWHDNMLWFGPSSIGSTYTIDRYEQQHQGPFYDGLRDIEFNGHVLEHAEG
ncbi:MAG: nuclear transport factor 2 family protein, partial [Pseudomonadota bacterium]